MYLTPTCGDTCRMCGRRACQVTTLHDDYVCFACEQQTPPGLRAHWPTFFFNCVAERAVKPCRSSRSNTRGGMIKSHGTCKTGNKHQNPNNKHKNNKQTKTTGGKCHGETCGEKKVKRPKHSCVELHQEAKKYHVSSSVKDEVNIP